MFVWDAGPIPYINSHVADRLLLSREIRRGKFKRSGICIRSGFRTKDFHFALERFHPRATDQIGTIRDGRENGLKALRDRIWACREDSR